MERKAQTYHMPDKEVKKLKEKAKAEGNQEEERYFEAVLNERKKQLSFSSPPPISSLEKELWRGIST